jgi:dihydroorotate dehydrogenase
MIDKLFAMARPLLFALPPEEAHELTLQSLERGLYPRDTTPADPALRVRAFGLEFPNPIGIAAGFDKNARVPDAALALGCGFAEIGTVTPLPQSGNPKPRVFRLVKERAVINRLGFNNEGHDAALARLSKRAGGGIIGVNIGANKDSPDRIADYVVGLERFNAVASYFMVNISSPNTTGLRRLQDPAALDQLLARVMTARANLVAAGKPQRPVVVKIAPDIGEDEIEPICAQLIAHQVDAIAVSNTTLSRPGLHGGNSREGGGLSGAPLFNRSTAMLARVYQATAGAVPLIGIGGIDSGETALEKIEAGASLIQLYTGLMYRGPGLIPQIKAHLGAAVVRERVAAIGELTGRKASVWAAKPLDPEPA